MSAHFQKKEGCFDAVTCSHPRASGWRSPAGHRVQTLLRGGGCRRSEGHFDGRRHSSADHRERWSTGVLLTEADRRFAEGRLL